jgi:hypothetical protein
MKKIGMLLISLSMIAAAGPAQAGFGNAGYEQAVNLKNRIESFVMSLQGVNGISVTVCDPQTGEPSGGAGHPFVYCVEIDAETQASMDALGQLLPAGSRVEGVLVSPRLLGTIEAQPRITAGN